MTDLEIKEIADSVIVGLMQRPFCWVFPFEIMQECYRRGWGVTINLDGKPFWYGRN